MLDGVAVQQERAAPEQRAEGDRDDTMTAREHVERLAREMHTEHGDGAPRESVRTGPGVVAEAGQTQARERGDARAGGRRNDERGADRCTDRERGQRPDEIGGVELGGVVAAGGRLAAREPRCELVEHHDRDGDRDEGRVPASHHAGTGDGKRGLRAIERRPDRGCNHRPAVFPTVGHTGWSRLS